MRIRRIGPRRRRRPCAAVVVLNGCRAAEARAAQDLAAAYAPTPLVVAVDGGWRACKAGRLVPALWVGDGDSSGRVPSGIETVVYDPDKDFSDLAGALRECARRGIDVPVVGGLLGGRLDHEWANVQELASGARAFAFVLAPTRRGRVVVTARGCRVDVEPGSGFSLFSVSGGATVSLTGAEWTLRRRRLRPGSTGLSNVARATVALTVHAGVASLVFPS